MLDTKFSIFSEATQEIPQVVEPRDLAQRMAALYDRAALRFRQHEDAQHSRIVRALEGVAVVQSGTIGGRTLARVIVCKREGRAA